MHIYINTHTHIYTYNVHVITGAMVLVITNHELDVVEEEVLPVQGGADGEAPHVVHVVGAQLAFDLGGPRQVVDDPVCVI